MKTKFFFIETYTDRLCTCKREIWGALEDWMHLGPWGWKHLKGKITVASSAGRSGPLLQYQWYYRAWLMPLTGATLRQSVWLMRSDRRSFQRSPSIWKHISVSHTGSVCPPGRSLKVTSSSTLINAVLLWVKHRNRVINSDAYSRMLCHRNCHLCWGQMCKQPLFIIKVTLIDVVSQIRN